VYVFVCVRERAREFAQFLWKKQSTRSLLNLLPRQSNWQTVRRDFSVLFQQRERERGKMVCVQLDKVAGIKNCYLGKSDEGANCMRIFFKCVCMCVCEETERERSKLAISEQKKNLRKMM